MAQSLDTLQQNSRPCLETPDRAFPFDMGLYAIMGAA